jgi:hypothetical protein
MRGLKTKRSNARIADPTLFGPRASSNFSPPRVSTTNPNGAPLAAPNTSAPSADIRRVRKLLAEMVLAEDCNDFAALADEVYDGLDRVCRTLDYLADKQYNHEFWMNMRK